MYFFVPDLSHILQKRVNFELIGEVLEHFWSCRVVVGQICEMTDLNGFYAKTKITKIDKKNKKIDFEILSTSFVSREGFYQKSGANHILFQAQIDKSYLEKWCEILPFSRFNKVFLFKSEFSLVQNLAWARLEKILIRSCCQGQFLYKPSVQFIEKNEFLALLTKFQPTILDCQPNQILNQNSTLKSALQKNVVIGPEGGFSQKERLEFQELGLEFQNLGEIIYPSWLTCLMV